MWRALVLLAVFASSALAQWLAPGGLPAAPPALAEYAPRPPAPAPSPSTADAPDTIEALRRQVAAVLERERVPGVGIALVDRDGPIWIGGVGVADTRTRVPVDESTVFRVASITKNVIGLGVMRLAEQGRLDLDRPLRALLPDVEMQNAWEAEAPVTLAHALEHTSGFDDMRPNESFTADDAMRPAAALAINSRSRTARWRPGTRFSYSNVGYGLAGRAIEVATGEAFDTWLVREVLRPLGMPDADFRRTPALAARLATGYHDGREMHFAPIAHRPAGALLASATDLAKLVQFWLRRGGARALDGRPIVSPAGLDRIERAATLPYPALDIDYGFGNGGDVRDPVLCRGHDGGLPGFLSVMRYCPSIGRGYVVLLNGTHSFRAYVEIRALVFAYLARGKTLPREPELPARPAPPGADFYAFASPRSELFDFVNRALLGWRATPTASGVRLDPLVGEPLALVPAGGDAYRLPGESGSSFRFTRGHDGAPVMTGYIYAEAAAWWPARLRVAALSIAMILLQLAPIWGISALGLAAMRRRRAVALDLALWPSVASLCFVLVSPLFQEAAMRQVLGEMNAWTIGICAATVAFALASVLGMTAAVRWAVRIDRPPLTSRLVPTACAMAAFGMTLWLGHHGIIGLRTWAW